MSMVKFGRIPHAPWSDGRSRDDLILSDTRHFLGKEVVITKKIDGENTTLTREKAYARSLDSNMRHPSRTYIQHVWSCVRFDIPNGWRIVGENMFARHSIGYSELPSYFIMFAIFNEHDICLSWDETQEWSELLGLEIVDEIWRGIYDRGVAKMAHMCSAGYGASEGEGVVIRTTSSFHMNMQHLRTMKYVRKDHVQTSDHWLIPNQLQVGGPI